jgi:hypothetical protein
MLTTWMGIFLLKTTFLVDALMEGVLASLVHTVLAKE